jgi:anti-sigma regulatory factor (Ser/Thr protein kinase)
MLEYRLKNVLGEIPRIHAEMEELPLPPKTVFNLNLILDELLTNTISYGYPQGGSHEILLRLSLENEQLDIELVDDAIPFNPLDAPEPDFSLPIEDRRVGGLGVFLVRKLSSEVRYELRGGMNHLYIRMKT